MTISSSSAAIIATAVALPPVSAMNFGQIRAELKAHLLPATAEVVRRDPEHLQRQADLFAKVDRLAALWRQQQKQRT